MTGGGVRIVLSHVDFPPDDIAFCLEILLRETGEEYQFEENTDKGLPGGARAIDVVNGPVKGGIGIPLSPFGINPGGQFRSSEGIRALEYLVLKDL